MTSNQKNKSKAKKEYQNRIRKLCVKVVEGDKAAESDLKKQLNNPLAQKVVEEAISRLSKTGRSPGE